MILEAIHLSKRFGSFTAVDEVSFSAEAGQILGMLGPNGAGKTTTIHMLLGLITPSAGEVRIFGKPMATDRQELLQRINFTAPYVFFPYRLTVIENLRVFARIYDVVRPERRIAELLEVLNISSLRDKPISKLSSGENTRVGLAKALLNDPQLVFLDEPTAYLDPEIAAQVKTVLLDLRDRRGMTIVYTSHNMDEVEKMCDQIVFLHHGRVFASGTPIEITQAVLNEQRNEPALDEVFIRVAREAHP